MLTDIEQVLRAYWAQFLFMVPRLLMAVLLLAIMWLLTARVQKALSRKLSTHSSDPLLTRFLTQVARWALVVCGLMIALQIAGFSGVVGGLLAGAGLSAFIVGFAFKDIAENFLAGIMLAFNRPFHLNDIIAIADVTGRVAELNIRTTVVKTVDGKDVFIPNSVVLKEKVTNFTKHGHLRQEFFVVLEAGQDVEAARQRILAEIGQEAEAVDEGDCTPLVLVDDLAGSEVKLRVLFWTQSEDYLRGTLLLRSRIMERVRGVVNDNSSNA